MINGLIMASVGYWGFTILYNEFVSPLPWGVSIIVWLMCIGIVVMIKNGR
jgi:hypothetical protein